MVKGNKKAHNYAEHSKCRTGIKKQFMESRNAKGVRWFDSLNMYSKNELNHSYNENIVKTKSINFKTIS